MNHYPVICFGEILWDRLPSGDKPGGAPMNVAYHLNQLGLPAALISRVGKDELGDRLLQLLETKNITTHYIQKDPKHETGLVLATVHPGNEVTYEIRQPVAWDFIAYEKQFAALLEQADYFVFGSLAARSKTSQNTLHMLLEKDCKKVCDINLRAPHYTRQRIEWLMEKSDIVKLNENELPLVSGWYHKLQNRTEQLKMLQDKFRIGNIIVTCGDAGALLLTEDQVLQHPGYKVNVKDTVGSGDAFLAAYLFAVAKKMKPEDCLQFANRLGAFMATKEGACPNYSLSEMDSIQ